MSERAMKYSCAVHKVGRIASKGEPFCDKTKPNGLFFCTRAAGHKGDHIAHVAGGKPIRRWRNK